MKVEFVGRGAEPVRSGAAIVFSFEGADLAIDPIDLGGAGIEALKAVMSRNGFVGAENKHLSVLGMEGLHADRLLIVGLGARKKLTALAAENGAARACQAISGNEIASIDIWTGCLTAEQSAHAALGVLLATYKFNKYHTVKKVTAPAILRVVTGDPDGAASCFEPLSALAEGICLARDLTSEPSNILFPASFAERVRALEARGVAVTVLGEKDMGELGMGALLGVGQGSKRESQLVICEWRGAADSGAAPVLLVGKGVTFDSGGLSIKPAKAMEDMKYDMGGAAAVVGTILALATRKARANVIGVLGLVENMPDGNAQRPGDVVTSLSGQTIEIINTDAEGRLVLADALWYAQREFKPCATIDLATLTGNVSYALGDDYAALLANDDALADDIIKAADGEGEPMWRLPLVAAYDKLHDTPAADMKNVGGHFEAGTITAALFLQRFVNKTPWAHVDIASVVWRTREDQPTLPKGATGYGVRFLNRLIADRYEEH